MSGAIGNKLRRLTEATHLAATNAADWRSRRVLASIYWTTVVQRGHLADEVELQWRVNNTVFPIRLRRSDVYTLAEIFHEQQVAVRATVPDHPLIIDAGANVGFASLWFLGHYPGARVHCFEPAPDNLALLRHNVESTGSATVNAAAVGRSSGSVTLHMAEHGAMHSTVDSPHGSNSGTIQVPSVALHEYLREHAINRVHILKLDVEGAELEALEGLADRIRDVDVIVGELHEQAVSEDAFYGFLRAAGFVYIRKTEFASGQGLGVHGFEATRTQ